MFNTFGTMPDTPKTNHNNMKTWKNKPKNTILPCSKTTHYFYKFSVFSTYSFAFWKAVLCWKHCKNSVFREKHSFSKTQLVKPSFSTMSKNTFFRKKGVIFGFGQFPLKPIFFIVVSGLHCFGPKLFLGQNSVHENARFFSLPDTNSVSQFLLKIHFSNFSHFWMTTLKKPIL